MSKNPYYDNTKPTPNLLSKHSIGTAFLYGCAAGLIGVGAMTFSQKIEQAFTGRPNSYVPGHTLEKLLGMPYRPDSERLGLQHAMHWGQGALVGGLRGVMSAYGIVGFVVDFLFTGVRILTDQSLENYAQVGAPPWTWPFNEQVIDVIHKGVYAFTTGYVVDRWLH